MSDCSSVDFEEPFNTAENSDFKAGKSSLKPSRKPAKRQKNSFDSSPAVFPGSKPESQKNSEKKNTEKTPKKAEIGFDNTENLLGQGTESRKPGDSGEGLQKSPNKFLEKPQHPGKDQEDQDSKASSLKTEAKFQSQRRTTDPFADQLKSFEKKKQDKIDSIRQERDLILGEDSHIPVINPRSKEILSRRAEDPKPVHEKLYQQAKPSEKSLSKKSKKDLNEENLKRPALFLDKKEPSRDLHTRQNSQTGSAKQFVQEFQKVFAALNGETEYVSLELARKGLVCLNFIRNNPEHPKFEEEQSLVGRFFKLAGGAEKVKVENLLKICLAVINVYTPSMTIYSEKGPFGVVIDGNYSINKEEVIKVHKLFNLFYENRQLSAQVIKDIPPSSFLFKPQIASSAKNLEKLAQKRSGSLFSSKREGFIQEEKKKTQEKIEKIKKDREAEEAKHCTFKPTLISKSVSKKDLFEKDRRTALYEKSKEINEKKKNQAKNLIEYELEKDMNECTFTPKLDRVKVKEDTTVLNSKSVQNQLIRMQKARDEQERKRSILERASSSKGLSGKKQFSKSPNSKKPKFSDFAEDFEHVALPEYSAKAEAGKEAAEIQIEVKLPNSRIRTLVIPPGADKEQKLAVFIMENQLTEEMGKKLRESLLSI